MRNSSGAAFVLSLDFELLWGFRTFRPTTALGRRILRARIVAEDLLRYLDRCNFPATWFVTAALALEPRNRGHRDLVEEARRRLWAGARDVPDGLLFAPRLVGLINSLPSQELGCHTFSHPLDPLDPKERRSLLGEELSLSAAAFARYGAALTSLAFPRNEDYAHAVASRAGYRYWRSKGGLDASTTLPEPAKKAGRALAAYLRVAPQAVAPQPHPGGLIGLPGSMFFPHNQGWASALSLDARVARACKGLDAAEESRGVFSLWLHPHNLADDDRGLLSALIRVLDEVRDRARRGRLRPMTLADACRGG